MNAPTSLTPEEFHERLAASLPDSTHDGSLEARVARDIASGRRTLRRRRAGAILASAACVAAVATGVALIPGDGPDQRNVPSNAPDPGEQRLLDQCEGGAQSPKATGFIFDSGTPAIKFQIETEAQTVLALESSDGSHWAQCIVYFRSNGPGVNTGMTVYDAAKTSTDVGYQNGPCGLRNDEVDPECRSLYIMTTDRLPDEVASVKYDFVDGGSVRVQTLDGYVVVNNLIDGTNEEHDGVHRITYFDSEGEPMAAMATDGTGSGPNFTEVDGLPLISEYPSLRGRAIN